MKITKAMGLVATSKLRKSRKELSDINEYAEIAMQNLKSVAGIVDENLDIPYFSKNDSEKILYIIITYFARLSIIFQLACMLNILHPNSVEQNSKKSIKCS